MNPKRFLVKESGEKKFASGMVRGGDEEKINYSLVADGPMLKRWAEHLTKGAAIYSPRNWLLAEGEEELLRAKESAFRHFVQWYFGEEDEDHASGVFFNINEVEYIKGKIDLQEA